MNTWVLPLGIACGLLLATAALSLFVLWRAKCMIHELGARPAKEQCHAPGELRALRETVGSLTARVLDIERQPEASPAAPGLPRPGMNMNKRSQALRMHRQGEQPEQIASALELPRQEVDLLLKVQQIVIANV
jgi:hypothetical protein